MDTADSKVPPLRSSSKSNKKRKPRSNSKAGANKDETDIFFRRLTRPATRIVRYISTYLPLFATQIISHIISSVILAALLIYAFGLRLHKVISERYGIGPSQNEAFVQPHHRYRPQKHIVRGAHHPDVHFPNGSVHQHDSRHPNHALPSEELATSKVSYYAERWGYDCEEDEVITADGFVLNMQRITMKGANKGDRKGPMLLVHGLFQSSGIFVTNEEDSMAFYFAREGYDVFLGNNRGISRKHVKYRPSSQQFWNWSLDDISKYDFPSLINHVLNKTGKKQVIYVGHSQGNAQAFMGLKYNPKLAEKISCFVALSPAVYIGPLMTSRFPLRQLVSLSPSLFTLVFGRTEFIPIMSPVQKYLPPSVFSALAYEMFSYLFDWNDANWVKSRKSKYFRSTPQPTSVKAIEQWMKAARESMLVPRDDGRNRDSKLTDQTAAKSNQAVRYDFDCLTCPIMIFYGGQDMLVQGARLCEDILEHHPNVNVLHAEEIGHYEHLDTVLAIDAEEKVWSKISWILKEEGIGAIEHS